MFCPRCGGKNDPPATECAHCGQDLRLVAHAVQRRDARRRPPRRLVLGSGGLALLLAAGLGWSYLQGQRSHQAALEHYVNGVWATEVGRWDRAVQEFGAAGNFQDAPQRRALAEIQLGQVQTRRVEALQALAAGRTWQAALLLHQVVTVLPDDAGAQRLLAEARERLGPLLVVRQQGDPPGTSTVALASAELGEEEALVAGVVEGGNASYAPNGRWLTFETLAQGRSTLWLTAIPTGATVALVEQAQDFRTRWAPDGRQLLVAWQGTQGWSLAQRDLAAGEQARLSKGADFVVGEFSPTGAWLFWWERRGNQWSLWLASADGQGEPRALVEQADSLGLVTWADDDSALAYGFYQNGQWRYQLAAPTGEASAIAPDSDYVWLAFRPRAVGYARWAWQAGLGTLALVTSEGEFSLARGAADGWLRWAPTGEWLLSSEWNGRSWSLWLWRVPAQGPPAEPEPLASAVDDSDALFSPTGRYLLLRLWEEGRWRVVVRDLRRNETHTLLTDALDARAAWSPDGRTVLLWWLAPPAEGAAPTGQLAVADAESGRRTPLLSAVQAVQGGFARDGSKMAFAAQESGQPARLWVANPDGSGLMELDRQGYRVFWALAPFALGQRPPEPLAP